MSEWYDFKIIFTSETESNRKWNFKSEIDKFEFEFEILNSSKLSSKGNNDNHFFHINKWFIKILEKEKTDIIIHAWWAWLSAWQSCNWCKKNNKKFVLWSWSTKYEDSWRRKLTKPLVKYLVRNSNSYLSYWTRASEYLESLWANKDKIFKLYNSIDTDFFLNKAKELLPKNIELKQKYWIKTKYTLLFIGQFIQRKGIFELLEWFTQFQKVNSDISLIFVWSWQEKDEMNKLIKEKNIKNIIFPWFIQQDKISELYALSDIFTLPSSEEVWWLVINEAMCFWLPILTAYKVWASVDLVESWKNGYIMKENTSKEVFNWLQFIFDNWLIKKNNSVEIINRMKIDNLLDNLKF